MQAQSRHPAWLVPAELAESSTRWWDEAELEGVMRRAEG